MILDRDPEFIATITTLYEQELGREPDLSGLRTFLDFARNGWTGDQIRQALHDSDEGRAHRAEPPKVPAFVIKGTDFIDMKTNKRIVLNGIDQFCALRQLMDGVDLTPFIKESRDLGFNMWRVFLQGSKAQNGVLQLSPNEPNYGPSLLNLVKLVNDNGILLLATVYVDEQDVLAGPTWFMKAADLLRNTGTLLSRGNEVQKNGYGDYPKDDPGAPFVWSNGSALSDYASPLGGNFTEFHLRRDYPKSFDDCVASWTFQNIPVPQIMTEGAPAGSERVDPPFDQPITSYRVARVLSSMWAGAVFHNRFSQSGRLMDAQTRDCAAAQTEGLKL